MKVHSNNIIKRGRLTYLILVLTFFMSSCEDLADLNVDPTRRHLRLLTRISFCRQVKLNTRVELLGIMVQFYFKVDGYKFWLPPQPWVLTTTPIWISMLNLPTRLTISKEVGIVATGLLHWPVVF